MELKKCPNCGKSILSVAKVCKHCGTSIQPQKNLNITEIDAVNTVKEEADNNLNPTQLSNTKSDKKPISKSSKIILIIVLAVIALAVLGSIYYYKVYLPAKIDREAERYYSIVNVNFRSSKDAGGEYNKIGSIPYGAELITYEHDSDWSYVKYKEEGGDSKKGYVSTDYLLNKVDFIRLNSIFGDIESKGCIPTAKCRRAILNYFKEKGYIGKISSDVLAEILPDFKPTGENQWQIFCRDFKMKPNNVIYPEIHDFRDSKFTDFGVIIKNINSTERRLLLFSFDDDETSHLSYEEPVNGNGYIVDIYSKYDPNDEIYSIATKYTDN